jgi:hypothetical protein
MARTPTLGDRRAATSCAPRLNQGREHYFLNMAEPFFESKKYEQPKTAFDQLTASNDPKIALLASQRLETLKAFDDAHESGALKQ